VLSAKASIDDQSMTIRLLADLRDVVEELDADRLPTESLLRALAAIGDAPWSNYLAGRPIDGRGLARLLGAHGLKPRKHRSGDMTVRGYQREELEDLFVRYLPPIPHGVRNIRNNGSAALHQTDGRPPDSQLPTPVPKGHPGSAQISWCYSLGTALGCHGLATMPGLRDAAAS
jgi:hypothetical protein